MRIILTQNRPKMMRLSLGSKSQCLKTHRKCLIKKSKSDFQSENAYTYLHLHFSKNETFLGDFHTLWLVMHFPCTTVRSVLQVSEG